MEGPRTQHLLGAVLALAMASACASDRAIHGDRVVHTELDFSVEVPVEAGWEPTSVPGAWLAYQRPGGARLTLQTGCFRRFLNAQLRARHLLIGVSPRRVLQSGPVAVGSWGGWGQVVAVGEGAGRLRLKTVTLLVEDCAYDFILSAREDFDALEPQFDVWWGSFEDGQAGSRP